MCEIYIMCTLKSIIFDCFWYFVTVSSVYNIYIHIHVVCVECVCGVHQMWWIWWIKVIQRQHIHIHTCTRVRACVRTREHSLDRAYVYRSTYKLFRWSANTTTIRSNSDSRRHPNARRQNTRSQHAAT